MSVTRFIAVGFSEYIVENFDTLKPISAVSFNTDLNKSEWDEIVDVHIIDMDKSNKILLGVEYNEKSQKGLLGG